MKDFIDSSFAQIDKESKILELGAGLGRDSIYLNELGYNVKSTDGAEAFVDELKNRGLNAEKLNIVSDDIPDTDVIFANAVFLHLKEDEFSSFLKKAHKALPLDGKLIFTVKSGEGEEWSVEKLDRERYFCYWSESDLRALLANNNFSPLTIKHDKAGPATWLQVVASKDK